MAIEFHNNVTAPAVNTWVQPFSGDDRVRKVMIGAGSELYINTTTSQTTRFYVRQGASSPTRLPAMKISDLRIESATTNSVTVSLASIDQSESWD
jgi:hypothetical protein